MKISKSGENLVRTTNKVIDRLRWPGQRRYGGDPLVDPETGISTESHHEMFARLVRAGAIGMHGTPGERRRKRS